MFLIKAINICDSDVGLGLLKKIKDRTAQFRQGLERLGKESIKGPHPVVPLMVRDTPKIHNLVKYLFDHGVLVVGLTFPVVPKGDETIRFQINACHTKADIEYVLELLEKFE